MHKKAKKVPFRQVKSAFLTQKDRVRKRKFRFLPKTDSYLPSPRKLSPTPRGAIFYAEDNYLIKK